jgi:hypothetical protein
MIFTMVDRGLNNVFFKLFAINSQKILNFNMKIN